MGIQRLSHWLSSSFSEAFSQEDGLEADHVYVDMNEILHKVLQSLGKNADLESFIEALTARLDNIFQLVTPQRSIFLAIDGAAPAAKIATQRKRRRERVAPKSSGKRRQDHQKERDALTVNMLTPGVPVMAKIAAALVEYCTTNFGLAGTLLGRRHKELPGGIRATVSGADCAGEGEHKILTAMLRNSAVDAGVHAVIGSDSDLLVLPLGQRSISSQVKVVRFLPKRMLSVCHCAALGWILKAQKKNCAMKPAKGVAMLPPSEQELGFRRDFVAVALLRGNDYLPPLVCDRDPASLWAFYLRWRPNHSPEAGLVGRARAELIFGQTSDPEEAQETEIHSQRAEHLAFRRAQLISFMACCSGSESTTAVAAADQNTTKVACYLGGLLWCLETYASSGCPDLNFSFPESLVDGADAIAIAQHVPVLSDDKLETTRSDASPLGPLTCAVAVLPVSEVRNLILPSAPCLSSLFEADGLLGPVARFESCKEIVSLEASILTAGPGSKKGIKRRKALDTLRRKHSDIDAVSLAALDAEVTRLCLNAPKAEARRLENLLCSKLQAEELSLEVLPATKAEATVELEEEVFDEDEEEEEEAVEDASEENHSEEEEEEEEEEEDAEDALMVPNAKRPRLEAPALEACPTTGHHMSMHQRGRLGGLALLLSGGAQQ